MNAKNLIFGMILVGTLFLTSIFLVFEERVIDYAGDLKVALFEKRDGRLLKIGFAEELTSFNPFQNNKIYKQTLGNVYESLVSVDRNLSIKPSLAITFGRLDEKVLEFKLRENVKFHDGSMFDAEDVLYSFKLAKENENSGLKSVFENIDEVKVVDDFTLQVKTKKNDSVIFYKIANIPIVPSGFIDFEKPIGSGPYLFESNEENGVSFLVNNNYWGEKGYWEEVLVNFISSKFDRVESLENGRIDFLVGMPPDLVDRIMDNLEYRAVPSLEVGFLVFNLKNGIFADLDYRKAAAFVVDKGIFKTLSGGFAREASQLVSPGVNGFNPEIEFVNQNIGKAKELAVERINSVEVLRIDFVYPEELKLLGDLIEQALAQIEIDVNLKPLKSADYVNAIKLGDGDLFYLAWRPEYFDSLDLFAAVFSTKSKDGEIGELNGFGFADKDLDKNVIEAQFMLDESKRLLILQDLMRKVVSENYFVVPLIESDLLFAFSENLNFINRIDGLIYFNDVMKE